MENNGNPSTPFSHIEQEIRNIRTLAGATKRIEPPPPPVVAEPPPRSAAEAEMHDLMHKTIDTVCDEWVSQLQQVRRNSEHIESLVLAQAAKIKADISKLYELGKIAAEEAQRGDAVNQKLMRELESLQQKLDD